MCIIGSHKLKPRVYKNIQSANNYMKLSIEKFQPKTMISLGTPVIVNSKHMTPTDSLKYPDTPTAMDPHDFEVLLHDFQSSSGY